MSVKKKKVGRKAGCVGNGPVSIINEKCPAFFLSQPVSHPQPQERIPEPSITRLQDIRQTPLADLHLPLWYIQILIIHQVLSTENRVPKACPLCFCLCPPHPIRTRQQPVFLRLLYIHEILIDMIVVKMAMTFASSILVLRDMVCNILRLRTDIRILLRRQREITV